MRQHQHHNHYSRKAANELSREIQQANLPFTLHVVEDVPSVMKLVSWATSHAIDPKIGLLLVAKNQTTDQSPRARLFAAPEDLKLALLLESPAPEAYPLIRLAYAWAVAEAVRVAAAQREPLRPVDPSISWPDGVLVSARLFSRRIAEISYIDPRNDPEHHKLCAKYDWEIPRNKALLGIRVGLRRPSSDDVLPTATGPQKISEFATTLDQWTKHPPIWIDLVMPLLLKIQLIRSFLQSDDRNQLAKIVSRRLAIGDNQHLRIELQNAPPIDNASFLSANANGISIRESGAERHIPYEAIVSIAPPGGGAV